MKKYLLILGAAMMFASCNKWLDVKPESQVTEEELFATETGFMDALNGVYTSCAGSALYGIELSAGLPEVLAQNYHIEAADKLIYREASLYNYKDPTTITRKDNVWRALYNAIANCNLILEKLEKKTAPMTALNYNLIKGEALALRAYLHLDALRLFGPSYVTAPSAKSIPYVTTFSNKVTPLSTVTEALNKMADDLNAAKALLRSVDPILTAAYKVGYPPTLATDTTSTELKSPVLFLQNRRQRMNYYAVCGTLARVYINLDKKAEALANATEVIDAKKFPWTKQADFINPEASDRDRIMYPELIFCWFDATFKNDYVTLFENSTVGFYLLSDAKARIYETGGVGAEDLRPKYWFLTVGGNELLQKYKRESEENKHPLVHPAIRLSELYYIAAEASFDTNPAKANEYLNAVRVQRGINAAINATSKQALMDELVKEMRKETYAEGQLFYLYKRLNRGIVGETSNIIAPDPKIFILPLPNDELEYGQR